MENNRMRRFLAILALVALTNTIQYTFHAGYRLRNVRDSPVDMNTQSTGNLVAVDTLDEIRHGGNKLRASRLPQSSSASTERALSQDAASITRNKDTDSHSPSSETDARKLQRNSNFEFPESTMRGESSEPPLPPSKTDALYAPQSNQAPLDFRVLDERWLAYDREFEKRRLWFWMRFLGVRFGQDPSDAIVISEIIVDVEPELIIETGTNSGGSTLLWAAILELLGQSPGRVLTCDPFTIEEARDEVARGRRRDIVDEKRPPLRLPTDYPFYNERVEAHNIQSTTTEFVKRAHELAAGAARVMVILDSDHHKSTVARELELLAPLVTVGSYLIVEDTKLDHLEPNVAGPLAAIKEWLPLHPEFEFARAREYIMYSQHISGYLKRVR